MFCGGRQGGTGSDCGGEVGRPPTQGPTVLLTDGDLGIACKGPQSCLRCHPPNKGRHCRCFGRFDNNPDPANDGSLPLPPPPQAAGTQGCAVARGGHTCRMNGSEARLLIGGAAGHGGGGARRQPCGGGEGAQGEEGAGGRRRQVREVLREKRGTRVPNSRGGVWALWAPETAAPGCHHILRGDFTGVVHRQGPNQGGQEAVGLMSPKASCTGKSQIPLETCNSFKKNHSCHSSPKRRSVTPATKGWCGHGTSGKGGNTSSLPGIVDPEVDCVF